MEKYQIAVLVLGLLAAVAIVPLGGEEGIYLGFVVLIIDGVLFMSFLIFNTSGKLKSIPKLTAHLREDAKGVVIRNDGEAGAVRVHVALVPLDIEFDVPEIAAAGTYEYTSTTMIREAKAVLTYQDADGNAFTHTTHLSALAKNEEDDILKPAFPMFGWK